MFVLLCLPEIERLVSDWPSRAICSSQSQHHCTRQLTQNILKNIWETEFYTPPVLGGAARLPFSAPAVHHSPRFFLQINSLPFFCSFFFVIFTGIRCGTDFFVTPIRSSGSRVDIAQKPDKSGQILDQHWKIFLEFLRN